MPCVKPSPERQEFLNAKARARYADNPEPYKKASKIYYTKGGDAGKANARSKAWRAENHERQLELTKKWRTENSAHVRKVHNAWVVANREATRAIANKWARANTEKRKTQMAKFYAASDKEKRKVEHKKWRDNLHTQLTGCKRPKICDACKRRSQRIHYDHDHKTGLFRGWLCHGRNIALGGVADSLKILNSLANYLATYKAAPKVKGQQARAQKTYAAKRAANALKTKLKAGKALEA